MLLWVNALFLKPHLDSAHILFTVSQSFFFFNFSFQILSPSPCYSALRAYSWFPIEFILSRSTSHCTQHKLFSQEASPVGEGRGAQCQGINNFPLGSKL